MRFFTYVLCALGFCCVVASSEAQIFRGFRSRSISSPLCVNGSCQVPTYTQPAPVIADPLANGVIVPQGVKPATKASPASEPVPAPKKAVQPLIGDPPQEPDDGIFFGVEWDKIKNHKYDDKAKQITIIEAMDFAKGNYDDVKKNLRLVVIGTPAERKPFEAAYAAMPPAEKEGLSPWFVSADHWSLRDSDSGEVLFVIDGHPTAYVLAPDGEPIHRQDGGDADEFIEAIRKGGKKYDPKRDPDLRRNPDPARVPIVGWRRKIGKLLPVALVCGTACFLGFMFRRRTN